MSKPTAPASGHGDISAPTPLQRFMAGWARDVEALDRSAIANVLQNVRGRLVDAFGVPLRHEHAFWVEMARCVPEDVPAVEVTAALARIHAEDLYLALGCRKGDDTALVQFEAKCIAALASVIARVDPSAAFGDEVRQRIRTKLLVASQGGLPKIAYYTGRGELLTWVKVVALREAVSLVRARGRHVLVNDDQLLALEASATGPELAIVKDEYREQFVRAFTSALKDLKPPQRNLIRLHYIHGLTIDELGHLLKVHRSSAARRIANVRRELLAATQENLRERLGLGHDELDALMQFGRSRLDLSIERLLDG